VAEYYYFAKHAERANHIVDITPFIDRKIDALCAHDSQMKLTIDDMRLNLAVAGMDPNQLAMLDRDNYRPALEMAIRQWAGNVGAKAGFEYGEEFRRETAGDLLKEIMG
jgi:hypothetical protein